MTARRSYTPSPGGSTPFKLNLNFGDVGHTCIIGPTGAGKSVLLAALATAFAKYQSPRRGLGSSVSIR